MGIAATFNRLNHEASLDPKMHKHTSPPVVTVSVCFFGWFYLETGFLYVAVAVLELAL